MNEPEHFLLLLHWARLVNDVATTIGTGTCDFSTGALEHAGEYPRTLCSLDHGYNVEYVVEKSGTRFGLWAGRLTFAHTQRLSCKNAARAGVRARIVEMAATKSHDEGEGPKGAAVDGPSALGIRPAHLRSVTLKAGMRKEPRSVSEYDCLNCEMVFDGVSC